MRRILHLSDIHFTPWVNDAPRTLNEAARADLLADLTGLGEQAKDVDAILVVGDLAARGKREEYDNTTRFLDEVCKITGCDRKHIGCVPGNHDVDRSAQGLLNSGLRRMLRTEKPSRVEHALAGIYRDQSVSEILHAPLSAYNDFAKRYGFEFNAATPVPGAWELDLDGRPLRIYGVNSALVCDDLDSDRKQKRRVILGVNQLAALTSDHGAISILMCHHPPGWLRDRKQVEPWLARPHILLTGHEHMADVRPSEDGRTLHIASGAVNPERGKGPWEPSYNLIDLNIDGEELLVRVRARVHRGESGFTAADGDDPQVYPVALDLPPIAGVAEPEAAVPIPVPRETDDKDLVFRILDVAPDAREAAAATLGLLPPSGRVSSDPEDRRLIETARERGLLSRLADECDKETAQ